MQFLLHPGQHVKLFLQLWELRKSDCGNNGRCNILLKLESSVIINRMNYFLKYKYWKNYGHVITFSNLSADNLSVLAPYIKTHILDTCL